MDFNTALIFQKSFSSLFFDSEQLTQQEKEEITKSFVLALHSEASDLISAVNFKDHRKVKNPVNRNQILYESVDIIRYVLAILNLWDFNAEEFVQAFRDKDLFLNMRHGLQRCTYNNQPVVIVDMDDVLVEFRSGFNQWLKDEKGVIIPKNNPEYYNTTALLEKGIVPEEAFQEFVDIHGFGTLTMNSEMAQVLKKLQDDGFWIQILTARPYNDLTCRYDTYAWLKSNMVDFDSIAFSPEKYRWLLDQQFFVDGKVVCAIDDSAKHAAEFAKHGIKVISPNLSYNQELKNIEGVVMYSSPSEVYDLVHSLAN